MNRSILSICLLACMVAPVAATLAWLRFQKEAAKSEAAKISPSDLGKEGVVFLVLVGTAAQDHLEWEHGREFSYHGEMYDVIEYKISGDTAFYWCWHDVKETWLNRQIEALLKDTSANDPLNTEAAGRLLLYYKSLYFNGPNDWPIICKGISGKKKIYPFLMRLNLASDPPKEPPPRSPLA